MFFRLKYVIKPIDLGEKQSIRWESDKMKYPTPFILRPLSNEEIKHDFKKSDLMCIVTAEHDVAETELSVFKEIKAKIPKEIELLVDQMQDHLYDCVIRTIGIFHWMRGEFEHEPIRYFRAYQYSFDNDKWKNFQDQVHIEIAG